jgi:hypothetical protein
MTTCPKCGHEHDPTRCNGHNRAGQQCGRNPMRGTTVCRAHGGASPQVKAAAEQRQASAAAERAVSQLVWRGLADASPVKDPVDLLARLAGVLEHAVDVMGTRLNDLQGKVGAGEHLTQLRAEVVLLEKLLGHLRAVARDLAALGIAERQVELAAGQADIVVAAVRAGLAALGPELLPDQRDVFLRAFLAHLVGAGGVSPPELGEAS